MKPIGKVIHYYEKLGVAIIKLQDSLKIGDTVRIEKEDYAFEQKVLSIHKDYEPVKEAEKGDDIGLKVDQKVSEGALVLLV